MNQDQALELHRILLNAEPEARIEGANWFYQLAGLGQRVKTEKQAEQVLYALYLQLLDHGQTTEAALLLWGKDEIFDPRPKSVQRIWKALDEESKILIPGAGDQGKSYTPSAWVVLWWTHDPQWTSVKVLSVTASHAAANVMATIKTFHEYSAIRLPGRAIETIIDLGDGNRRSSISMVSIPQGGDVKGRLRGFHPVPRPVPHPIFGRKSRIGVFIDEGEDVPVGLWEGLENILSSETRDSRHLKIFSGANPKKRESPFARRCEFPGGWQNFDIDSSHEWIGPVALGSWKVVRLDAATSENVVEQREVFPGMMTYDGFMNYVRKGTNDPAYFTFGRGAWPEFTAEYRITPPDFFTNSVGMLTFTSDVVPVASLDPAFSEGGDSAILTTGRYGTAIGFTPLNGDYEQWGAPKKCIQIEQQFPVQKGNVREMDQTVIRMLRQLQVRPEWFIIDRTGVGHGLSDSIRYQYGDILGLSWSEKATATRILEEDTSPAEELYAGVITEMAFGFAIWLQFGYIKFAPLMDSSKILTQATNRKYYFTANGLMRAEDKLTYKASSGGVSPDEYDSAIMLPHLVRLRESQKAQMVPPDQVRPDLQSAEQADGVEYGPMDKMEFYSPIT